METIDKAGEDVERNIRTVIVSLTKIQYLLLPYDQKTTHLLNVTTHRLGKGSRLIQSFLHHNGRSIDLAIKISYDHILFFFFFILSDSENPTLSCSVYSLRYVSHLLIASTNLFILFLAFGEIIYNIHNNCETFMILD